MDPAGGVCVGAAGVGGGDGGVESVELMMNWFRSWAEMGMGRWIAVGHGYESECMKRSGGREGGRKISFDQERPAIGNF